MTKIKLPPIDKHDHPECRVMTWTELELEAIKQYATQAVTEDRAQCDATHLAELRAYELTVANLREQLVTINHPDDQAPAQLFLPCEPDGTPEGLAFTTRASAEEYARAVAADIGDGAREMRIADVTLVKAPTQVGHQGAAMTPDKLMKLIDDYACEVANTPSSPTPTERNLATERIERARNVVVTELARPEPTQPAWHDAPNAPGLWVSIDRYSQYDWHLFRDPMTYPLDQSWVDKSRYFGPIPLPEDRK